jgi:eukaryotic-like serine/threonine-protein kinase
MSDQLLHRLQTSLGTAYTLERELGGGGMSRIFVAREEALQRDVVVKVLTPDPAHVLSAERFAREIRFAARLQDPHVVPVLAAGTTSDGVPYYTMPFVRGESLRVRMAHGRVPIAEGVGILRDVAHALAHAHGHGVVHRDIKPENVLLSEGTAVVTDFGIARAIADARTHPSGTRISAGATLTEIGTSLGTPAYMSPEQAAGDVVDERTDVYAWGLVAFELLAGQHPFADRGTSQQLIAAQISELPAKGTLRDAGVPEPLAELLMHCLAKDPEERPPFGAALLASLQAITSGAFTPTGSGWRERPRLRWMAVALLVAVAVAALLLLRLL